MKSATHKFDTRGKVGYLEGRNWVIWDADKSPDAPLFQGGAMRVTDPQTNQKLTLEAVAR